MKLGCHCRLVKRAEAREGAFPVHYWCCGVLTVSLTPGQPISMDRYARAAREDGESAAGIVVTPGVFTSSPILSIKPPSKPGGSTVVTTENSTYELTPLGAIPKDIQAMLDVGALYIPPVTGTHQKGAAVAVQSIPL